MSDFIPTAYVKTNCPYSFKFRLFMTEAGLLDQIAFEPMDPTSDGYAEKRAAVGERIGHDPVFPLVEIAPGEFLSDSDAMIAHFAAKHGVDADALPTLQFYKEGLFVTFLELFDYARGPVNMVAHLGKRPRAFL